MRISFVLKSRFGYCGGERWRKRRMMTMGTAPIGRLM
jgi:hypothetical protein